VVQKQWTFGLTAVAAVLVAGGMTVVCWWLAAQAGAPEQRVGPQAWRGGRHDWNAGWWRVVL
jgi:hypothetical protein